MRGETSRSKTQVQDEPGNVKFLHIGKMPARWQIPATHDMTSQLVLPNLAPRTKARFRRWLSRSMISKLDNGLFMMKRTPATVLATTVLAKSGNLRTSDDVPRESHNALSLAAIEIST